MISESKKALFEKCGVPSAVFRLAFPTVIGQIILVVYNMADTFFVGLSGNDAMLTAVTVCMPAFMLLSAISNLFGVGGASTVARAMGSHSPGQAKAASSFAFWGCITVTLLYSAGTYLAMDVFVDALGGTHADVHANASEYLLCTVVAGGAATSVSILLSHLIRSEGRSVHASIGIALGGLMNIALDPLFMFRILPPGKEALGAAIATTLANIASVIYFIVVLIRIRKKTLLFFLPLRSALRRDLVADILASGLPACVMTLFENVSYAVLDNLMSLCGLAMQAGIGVAKKVNMLAHCIVRGIAQGSLPLIAYNYSARNYDRMRESVRVSRIFAIGTAAACMIVNLIFARPLIGIFIHHSSDSLRYGEAFLKILCIGGPFSAGAYTVISFFQATGEGRQSFQLAILRKGIVDIPLMFLLQKVIPVYGIVLATPLADAACFLIADIKLQAYNHRLPESSLTILEEAAMIHD